MEEKNQTQRHYTKLNNIRDKYRDQSLKIIAILVTIIAIASQVFPEVQEYIIKNGVINYITLLLVIDLAVFIESKKSDSSVNVFGNQDESMDILISKIQGSQKIDLLEYAGVTTLPLIRAIRRYNIPVRILIKHPDTVEGMQRQRTIATIDTLYNSVFDDYQGRFEIRCYRLPYTLRARYFHGKLLELGWLTPDLARRTTYGSGNPLILFNLLEKGNDHVREFFNRTFKDYWEHQDTEDAKLALQREGNLNRLDS